MDTVSLLGVGRSGSIRGKLSNLLLFVSTVKGLHLGSSVIVKACLILTAKVIGNTSSKEPRLFRPFFFKF